MTKIFAAFLVCLDFTPKKKRGLRSTSLKISLICLQSSSIIIGSVNDICVKECCIREKDGIQKMPWHVWHSTWKRAGPGFLYKAWLCGLRQLRILHTCLEVVWHSLPPPLFCFPDPRAYFERHSHGHNRNSLSHTHIPHRAEHSISNRGRG